jgi:murein DD-endopeptidase MepM/ murein hydrolase activator NlpD
MRWARRLSGRFAELERLRAAMRGRRVRWLTERLALVRSSQGIVAIAVVPAWQIAAFGVGGVSAAALIAGLLVAAQFRASAELQVREIVALREEIQVHAARAAAAEREGAESVIEADRRAASARAAMIAQTVVEQSRLAAAQSRLAAERDAAVERAASVLEQATAERRRLERDRDRAQAERDDLVNEVDGALQELDGDTRRTVAAVERIIAATGMDPRPARPRSGDPDGARGGPYIPWQGPLAATDASVGRFETVARRLERLKALRDVLQQLPIVMPVTHAVISGGFGFRFDPFNGVSARHEGIDLRAISDPTVHAPGAGTVVSAGWNGEFGNMVEIDHGFAVVTRYAHLARISVRRGDVVAPGQPLGVIGATGRATGAHLHYEIRVAGQPRDPLKFLSSVRATAVSGEAFAGFERP